MGPCVGLDNLYAFVCYCTVTNTNMFMVLLSHGKCLYSGQFLHYTNYHGEQQRKHLEVYRRCEDFLALGPEPKASLEMVLADLEISRQEGGCFCGIYGPTGNMLGGC